MIEVIGIFLTILAITLLMGFFIGNINCGIRGNYVVVRIGKFVIRKVAISDIIDVESGISVGGENWVNTLSREKIKTLGVTVHRKSGLFKRLNITPKNPAEFVKEVKEHAHFGGKGGNT